MKIKNNLKFFFSFLLLIIIITFLSDKYLMNNFIDIEKENNKKSIYNIVNSIDEYLRNINLLAMDYAHWNETYNFIKDINNNYVKHNFSEGTNTLEELELDFLIMTSKKNKEKFSNYNKKYSSKNIIAMNKDIIKKFKDSPSFTSLYKYEIQENKYLNFIITKVQITNSTQSKKTNSFIYLGKLISLQFLNKIERSFDKVKIENKIIKSNLRIDSKYLKNIQIETTNKENLSFNTISFYDINKEYVFSIITQKNRALIQKGKSTIFTYNLAICGFLFFIFILIYRHQIFLENYSKRLERSVSRKTKNLKSANKRLRTLSQTDELTKINNRRNFFNLGERALKKSINQNLNFSILMIDIDDFKKINDTYGHDIGDQVLIHISKSISSLIEKNSIFARLGGEEFALIFLDINEKDTYALTEKIRKTINDSIIEIKDKSIKYTISIGLAKRENNTSIDKILKEADTLLYSAKSRGKNCIIRNIDN